MSRAPESRSIQGRGWQHQGDRGSPSCLRGETDTLFLMPRLRRKTHTQNHTPKILSIVSLSTISKLSTHGCQLQYVLHCHCMYFNTPYTQCSLQAPFLCTCFIYLFSYLSFLPSDLSIQSVLWTTKLTFSHLLPLHDEMALAARASINPPPPHTPPPPPPHTLQLPPPPPIPSTPHPQT